MNNHKIESYLSEFLDGELDPSDSSLVQDWLNSSPEAQKELESLKQIRNLVANEQALKIPSSLRENFYLNLAKETEVSRKIKSNLIKLGFIESVMSWFSSSKMKPSLILGFTYSLLIFSVGFYSQNFFENRQQPDIANEIATQVNDLKLQVLLSQLEHPSVSVRLRGVRYGLQFEALPDEALQTLASVISQDPSNHVRIAAAQVMFEYIDDPITQERIKQLCLSQQNLPVQLMILSMIDDWDQNQAKDLATQIKANTENSEDTKQLLNKFI